MGKPSKSKSKKTETSEESIQPKITVDSLANLFVPD
jgi:hypothetical protein